MSTERMPARQGGLTLIELVIFLIIVSVAAVGILGVLNYTNRNSADPQRRKQAVAIAESLLEEVQLARFTYCDPASAQAESANAVSDCTTLPEAVGQETAASNQRPFDNVNDYVATFGSRYSFTPSDTTGIVTDAAGVRVATYANSLLGGYRAFVRLDDNASLHDIAGAADGTGNTDLIKITVTVEYDNESVVLEGYRTRYAPNALP